MRNDLILIVGVALILRLFLLLNNLSLPIKYYVDPDAYDYEIAAHNLLQGHGFSGDLEPPYSPDVFRTPTYPIFISGIYAISGNSEAVVIFIQLIFGSVIAGLLYSLLLFLGFSRQKGIIAGLLFAADPLTILNANLLMSETLFSFLIVAALFVLFAYWHSERMRWLLLASFLFGIAALARPIGQFLPLVLLPLFLLAAKTGTAWKAFWRWGVLFLLSSILIYSWAYRNYQVAENFTLSIVGDYNLAYYRGRAVLEEAEGLNCVKR
ncbi:MAG: phospholipid carrier-dependent glycosyltransferase [Anaerolineae bacterium]|nr:phospholipid carrier-dependent glycosyltransferase [Anaerolineae bacterium]MBT7991718.1 phospholipid carrier-dependent glycosyltransferase [Anaerolineae bacterium]